MTKLPTQTGRGRQRRRWCGTGECWAVECDTCCKGVARPSTCLALYRPWVIVLANFPGSYCGWSCPTAWMADHSVPHPAVLGAWGHRAGGDAQCRTMEGSWTASSLPGCWGRSHQSQHSLHRGQFTQIFFCIWSQKNQTNCAANCFRHFLSSSVTFSEGYSKIGKRSYH